MSHIESISSEHRIGERVTFFEGNGGLNVCRLAAPDGTAEIYLNGATVTDYTPTDARPVLWLSEEAVFENGIAIRGGVPIVFPWFGGRTDGEGPAHGYARITDWGVINTEADDEQAILRLGLPETGKNYDFPAGLVATFEIRVGKSLDLTLVIANEASKPIRFENALHTYFSVSDVREIGITGLEGTTYLDKMADGARLTEGDAPIRFTEETDRVYLDTTATCSIADRDFDREIVVAKSGSNSTVVWNPWIAKAARMGDFPDEGWPEMVCVESGNIADNAVTLPPGQVHTMSVRLVARAM